MILLNSVEVASCPYDHLCTYEHRGKTYAFATPYWEGTLPVGVLLEIKPVGKYHTPSE